MKYVMSHYCTIMEFNLSVTAKDRFPYWNPEYADSTYDNSSHIQSLLTK